MNVRIKVEMRSRIFGGRSFDVGVRLHELRCFGSLSLTNLPTSISHATNLTCSSKQCAEELRTMQQPTPSEETQNLLARLSQRPGVQSTLILSRETGAIVRASGLITPEEIGEDGTAPTNGTYVNGTDGDVKKKGTRKAEEVAQLVYNFVKSAGSMIEELNGENDEAKLLRVRTKKNELVVVPGKKTHSRVHNMSLTPTDSKFLLVVIHDTPPA